MKKIVCVLGVIASALVLASCASNKAAEQTTAPATPAPAHHGHHHHHHDYKGETK